MAKKLAGTKTLSDLKQSAKTYGKCYDTHPPLPLKGGRVVFGGSCTSPVEADVFVGLDHGCANHTRLYPWTPGEAVYFYIQDMGVPTNVPHFKALIGWMIERIDADLRVHVGCIGGHGRTGMVLAALVKEYLGEEDAITYVRTHYCKKAVESQAQIEWLHKHFGIKRAEPSKKYSGSGLGAAIQYGSNPGGWDYGYTPTPAKKVTPATPEVFEPQPAQHSIWGI